MKKVRYILLSIMLGAASTASAQYENSGISAGFFDSSETSEINFSKAKAAYFLICLWTCQLQLRKSRYVGK